MTHIAINKTKTSYKKVLNFRRKSPNLLNAAPLSGRLELQVWTFSAASAAAEKAAGNRLRGKSSPHPPSPSPPSWMGRPVRGEGVMWRQLYIHFGRFLYVWTFSFSNKIKNKIRWQAQIQIQIQINFAKKKFVLRKLFMKLFPHYLETPGHHLDQKPLESR